MMLSRTALPPALLSWKTATMRQTRSQISCRRLKERAHYHYWLFGHYHDNRAIDEKHILLWEQIIQVI